MSEFFYQLWGTLFQMGITTLHELPSGAVWNSGSRTDPSPSHERLQIFYSLVFGSVPVSAARFDLWIISGDASSISPIWEGGISASAGQITSASGIAAALAAMGTPDKRHEWQANHGATFNGSFIVENFGPTWQLVIQAVGLGLASSGSQVRYRYGTTEG